MITYPFYCVWYVACPVFDITQRTTTCYLLNAFLEGEFMLVVKLAQALNTRIDAFQCIWVADCFEIFTFVECIYFDILDNA